MPDPNALTTVHLIRHGEVDNPGRVLYGRLPDYHLSPLGQQMAQRVAEYFAGAKGAKITQLISSPLERAQETMAPLAQRLGIEVRLDPRVIEAGNAFEGLTVGSNPRQLLKPKFWPKLINPLRPSWGEPYTEIADRMTAAIHDARDAAWGSEAAIVSHQLPIWIARQQLSGLRLWHDPRSRECGLASITSVIFRGDEVDRIDYTEPAADLAAKSHGSVGA